MAKDISLEETIRKLEGIEAYFQKPDMNLEDAIEHHKEALTLAKEIMGYLEKAESSIQEMDIKTVLKNDEL